jgi:DNA-binding LacI/PurR family transcriptional regulator
MKRATSIDVAIRAGVTQPTVSRALAGHPAVHPDTRKRIVEAALDLNYVIDRKAASLKRKKTQTLALVVICRQGETRSSINPFYFALLGSIAAAASRRHLDLLVSFQDDETTFRSDFIEAGMADAIIVIGTTMNPLGWAHFRDAHDRGVNITCWGRPGVPFDSLCSDNVAGGRMATGHLIKRGCRNIIFIGQLGSPQQQFDERFAGYAQTMEEADRPSQSITSNDAYDRHQQGCDAVDRLIEQKIAFDGIVAACDMIALGALQALKAHNIAVPDQVAVIGFDGIGEGSFCEPSLTTIEPALTDAGIALVDRALAYAGHVASSDRIPVTLVQRKSS